MGGVKGLEMPVDVSLKEPSKSVGGRVDPTHVHTCCRLTWLGVPSKSASCRVELTAATMRLR